MRPILSRILLVAAAAAAISIPAHAAMAADKIVITYSDTVADTDIRAQTLKTDFGDCLGDAFDFKPYHGATLFKQGTELTAMQRGNLDTASLAIPDLYNQVPELSILSTAYLYSDYNHMRKVWDSGVLDGLLKDIEDKANIKVLTNLYIGTRELNLRGDKKIMTPADLAGVKLRMPGGEGWQFIGKALGANPTPVAFTEVYTALQTGAVDAQDNALPADKSMKFYEVTNQIVLTNHVVANNLLSISKATWDKLSADQQAKVQECATGYRKHLDKIMLDQEATLVDFFKQQGLKVYDPDRGAFRKHVLEVYKNSKYSKDWPPGLLDKINAL